MYEIPDVTELLTKGFIVIRNFASPEEIELLRNDFFTNNASFDKKHMYKNITGTTIHNIFQQKAQKINEIIRKNTDIQVDFFFKRYSSIFDTREIANIWHTDHDPYYMWQNAYNVITYWIPFIKPDFKKSNMMFFPRNKMPNDLDERTRTIGAQYCVNENNQTQYWECDSGLKETWNFDIEDYAEIVEVNVGDLIIFRDDVIHRSQNSQLHDKSNSDYRVAIAFRCVATNSVLSKAHLTRYSEMRQQKIDDPKNIVHSMSKRMLEVFEEKNTDFMTIREFFDHKSPT